MTAPREKLADSLAALRTIQDAGTVAIRSADLSRVHRERLLKSGFLQRVMKGWYIPSRPDEERGESTAWYASFWGFCAAYLNARFQNDWSLSPEQSLFLHAGNRTIPQRLLVRSPKARNKVTKLAHGTSILEIRALLPEREHDESMDGLRVFSLPASLIYAGVGLFRQNATDARTALAAIRDASDVLGPLLAGEHSVIAGRLAGAFRNIGRDRIADEIIKGMEAAGYGVRESDPFTSKSALSLAGREPSPYVSRMKLMWDDMGGSVIQNFPKVPGLPKDKQQYLQNVDAIYVTDAYHSLSIEGYRVSAELIERVRSGAWNPDDDEADREHRDALAARGYWQTFQLVKENVAKVLDGANSGQLADDHHADWYRGPFGPSVTAGIVKPVDLAGYRNGQVHIRHSMHVPPPPEAVRELMPVLFELIRCDEEASVRVVLGHFMFVWIHPYMDGNGRIGRFLMNLMLASGGYPWTVIPVERRNEYMASLESASVGHDIAPFTAFLADLVRTGLEGKQGAKAPT